MCARSDLHRQHLHPRRRGPALHLRPRVRRWSLPGQPVRRDVPALMSTLRAPMTAAEKSCSIACERICLSIVSVVEKPSHGEPTWFTKPGGTPWVGRLGTRALPRTAGRHQGLGHRRAPHAAGLEARRAARSTGARSRQRSEATAPESPGEELASSGADKNRGRRRVCAPPSTRWRCKAGRNPSRAQPQHNGRPKGWGPLVIMWNGHGRPVWAVTIQRID